MQFCLLAFASRSVYCTVRVYQKENLEAIGMRLYRVGIHSRL